MSRMLAVLGLVVMAALMPTVALAQPPTDLSISAQPNLNQSIDFAITADQLIADPAATLPATRSDVDRSPDMSVNVFDAVFTRSTAAGAFRQHEDPGRLSLA
jgi:hypothetical protein